MSNANEDRSFTARMMRAYPMLFSDYLAGRSIEIGSGWEPLVEEMCQRLVDIDPHYRITQIKEKFGLLTVYGGSKLDPPDSFEEGLEIVIEAGDVASKTCSSCGSASDVSTGYDERETWVDTLCSSCRTERKEKSTPDISGR